MKPTLLSSLLAATLLIACGASNDPPSAEGNGGDVGVGGNDGGGGGGGAPGSCPSPTSGPTFHGGSISSDELWTAEASPHVITSRLDVVDGATLEIAPCAIVELAQGVDLNVAFPGTPNSGTLVAEGTSEQPIVFRPHQTDRWGRIYVHEPGVARLAHVTLDSGGGSDTDGASLVAMGDGVLPTHPALFVDAVTIVGSFGTGAVLDRMARFADGSKELTISGNGNEDNPYPLRVDEHAIDSIPSGGSYMGNWHDAILVDPKAALEENSRIKNLGVPYRIGDAPNDALVVGSALVGSNLTVLTVDPGVTLAFFPGSSLRITHATGAFPATGALVAIGTPDSPITFRSAAEVPAPGDWVGIWFGGIVAPETELAYARIEHTGADCGCVLLTCSAIDQHEGAIIMTQEPPRVFLEHSVIANGSGHGVVLGYQGTNLDFATGNAFDGMGQCAVTLPSMPTCPNPKPACN